MKAAQQLESLQNAANVVGLTVHQKHFYEDKRKKVPMFFLNRGKETVSPVLDYSNLTHFILGWIKCKQNGGK